MITVGELGEFGLIGRMTAGLGPDHRLRLGPGDDAAVLGTPDGRVVTSVDMYLEGRHFRRDWSSGTDVGHRVVAAALADVVAMGAEPLGLLVCLGVPPDLEVAWVDALAAGLRAECAVAGAVLAGGDVVRSDAVALALTALGDLSGRAPVTRAGARAGDVVAVCGRLGWSAAGFAVLSRGFGSPRVLVDAHRRPAPPYAAGPAAAVAGATAMCDVSDGLVQDIGHVAAASGVAVDLSTAAFEVPEPFRQVAAALGGADPLRWVLTGAEDHALVATYPGEERVPDGWRVVGRVLPGSGVTVDGAPYAGTGFDHFPR